MSGNGWYVYCTHWCISSIQPWLDHLLGKHFNCVWPLSERLTLLPFTLPISLPLPFCFPSGTPRMPAPPRSLSCQPLPSRAPGSVEEVVSSSALSRRFRFASERSETSWFVWQTQMPLNSHSPGSLPASYLVMHYSHPLWQPPPPPNSLASGEGQPHTTSLAENPYGLDVFASSGQLIEPRAGSIFSHNCS